MVTVVQRPQGLKIIDQAITATITGGGPNSDAVVSFVNHGLSTGAFVLIESDVDEYNGMWYVNADSADIFRFKANATAEYVEWYQDATIQYYQTSLHEWSSAFLPIIYKATNDHWPVNSVDPIRTVSSQADDNGYTQLTLSGSANARPFENIKLTGGSAEGVWQVVEASGSVITITLPYDSTNTFTSIQKYYSNYQVLVNIYAGLPTSHPWNYKKPVELVATLSLTPDENNTVMFSVADYIRKQLNIRNNPLLYTMPLNLDFFTGFYISTAESYDGSDSYTITTDESSFAVDSFEGYAIAGKLPFKNVYSGFYSEYVYTSGSPAKWLTNLTNPIGLAGKYWDASFIKNIDGDFELVIDKYANDYRYETEVIPYEDKGIGVYRMPVEFNAIYDQYCIRVNKQAVAARDPLNIVRLLMQNCAGATWTTGATPQVTLVGSGGSSGYLYRTFATNAGIAHSFTYDITVNVSAGTPITIVKMAILDDSCNVIVEAQRNHFGAGPYNNSFTLTPPVDGTRIGISILNLTLPNTKTYVLSDLDFDGSPAGPAIQITDELCIDIIGICVRTADGGEVVELSRRLLEDDAFRLTEDDGYRLLEE